MFMMRALERLAASGSLPAKDAAMSDRDASGGHVVASPSAITPGDDLVHGILYAYDIETVRRVFFEHMLPSVRVSTCIVQTAMRTGIAGPPTVHNILAPTIDKLEACIRSTRQRDRFAVLLLLWIALGIQFTSPGPLQRLQENANREHFARLVRWIADVYSDVFVQRRAVGSSTMPLYPDAFSVFCSMRFFYGPPPCPPPALPCDSVPQDARYRDAQA